MQTFLPYPSFPASAAVLDDRRLGKQRVETFQILRALVFPRYGWKNHPAVAMWRGFTPALVGYGLAVCAEWGRRGYADAVGEALLPFTGGVAPDLAALRRAGRLPPWLGEEAVHRSHRAALLRKNPQAYAEAFPRRDLAPAELPYVWPAPLFRRWPVHRHSALPLAEAAAAAGVDPDATGGVADALEQVRYGCPVDLPTAAAALAVVLALEPPGLWVTGGPDVRADSPAVHPPRRPAQARPPGRLAASIARPPEPADLAAMAAEVSGSAQLAVHPRTRLDDPEVRGDLDRQPPVVVARIGPDRARVSPGWPPAGAGPPGSPRRACGSPGG